MPHPEGNGRSLYWTALNKGKRSIAIDLRQPEQGRELVQVLATAPGPDAGVLLTNIGTPWLAHELLAARRADLISCTIQGNARRQSTAVDYTVNCATGYPARHRRRVARAAGQPCAAGLGHRLRLPGGVRDRRRGGPAPAHAAKAPS